MAGAATIGLFAASPAQALDEAQTTEIEAVIQNYLNENPHVIADALSQHQANEQQRQEQAATAKLSEYKDYFATSDLPFAGNPDGDVVIVEFFDYNCGFCKRALTDIEETLEKDDNVKIIFQEMPILGPSSRVMAEYSLAAHKQGKYFDYHRAIMHFNGSKDAEQLEKLAEEAGLDVEQLKIDAKSPEIAAEIQKSIDIAGDIGVRGTPAFIIGNDLHKGYLGPGGLVNEIEKARSANSAE